MATASSNAMTTTSAGENSGGSNVPQWKRDLIQRRRQQNKVFSNDAGSMKFCSTITSTTTSSTTDCEGKGTSARIRNTTKVREECSSGISKAQTTSPSLFSSKESSCGAIAGGNIGSTDDLTSPSVACNMRLEADLSLCSSLDVEHVLNSFVSSGSATPNKSVMEIGRINKLSEHENEDNVEKSVNEHFDHSNRCDSVCDQKIPRREMFGFPRTKINKFSLEVEKSQNVEDPESDSSEELQYGPGIVNKLKSKYLNLTLREMNKSRTSVQRFRRAASLEDLLDCDEDSSEKLTKRYTKRNNAIVATVKTDRYRNTSRGNDTMKRARSVETLMRYNASSTGEESNTVSSSILSNRFVSTTNGVRSELTSDHIILIDRTSIKIENRLEIDNRPKAVNKPKRIRPVLAETERPPPDLVKTTMRIFEGSTKKLRPKGEVAAKVATFKTINDTFKAQTQKKVLVPKPPLQPKPFTNGTSKPSSAQGSPVKKIILPQKPTAELIENNQEEFHIEGVDTDPIVQSVSLVVSKFQQIEKSHSPSPSPEPTSYKLRFSPAPSPEPQHNKLRSSLEMKSSPTASSPRISSPRIQTSPSSSKDNTQRQNSSPVHKLPISSSSPLRLNSPNVPQKPLLLIPSQESKTPNPEQIITTNDSQDWSVVLQESTPSNSEETSESSKQDSHDQLKDKNRDITPDNKPEESETLNIQTDNIEDVDSPKTISKSALENINKAGVTMQFTFRDESSEEKDYLPGSKHNGKRLIDDSSSNDIEDKFSLENNSSSTSPTSSSTSYKTESTLKIQEKELKYSQKIEEVTDIKPFTADNKQIGAICSLGLLKSSTTTSYPQNNESKTIRSQKTESSSSPPQKQIGIIRPLVSTKTQLPQQNLSDRELEKNLINRVKSIEQPTKVVVSLKSADEIQPLKKSTPTDGCGGGGGIVGGGGGLWDTKPWNQHNNTMVFNFSNRRDVPDYIENDGLIIRRKREKPKVGDGGIIVLDATLDASTTDDSEWEISVGPPSPCDVSFLNDNILINGRSNLSRQPRNHKHRIQFDDSATSTFEYPSEASMLEGESSAVDGETTSCPVEQPVPVNNKTPSSSPSSLSANSGTNVPSLLGGGGLANYTPSKVDLTSEGFELGVTRTISSSASTSTSMSTSSSASSSTVVQPEQTEDVSGVDYLKPAQDAGAWGSETTGDLLY